MTKDEAAKAKEKADAAENESTESKQELDDAKKDLTKKVDPLPNLLQQSECRRV